MPLFVTVTPGTTVTSSTTLDASTLNLLGTPSVDVTGTVDGGSITLGVQSVPLPSLNAQVNQTIVGNGAGSSASPVALTTTDLVLTATTVNINALAVTAAKIAANTITADKLLQIDGTTPKILGRFTTAVGNIETNLSVGSNLTTTGSTLNALRPAVALTSVTTAFGYAVPDVRINAVEIAALTTSITPQTATSKVLVNFNISFSISGDVSYRYAFILTKTIGGVESEIGVPSGASALQVYGIKPLNSVRYFAQENQCIQFLDTPGAATATTYKLKVYGSSTQPLASTTGFYINRCADNSNSGDRTIATSQVILQEILP
jgi:hypothetical protein